MYWSGIFLCFVMTTCSADTALNWPFWEGALVDALTIYSNISSVHVVCQDWALCPFSFLFKLNIPYTFWVLQDGNVTFQGSHWELYVIVSNSNESAINMVTKFKSNKSSYIIAWPAQNDTQNVKSVLVKFFSVGKLRSVALQIPRSGNRQVINFFRITPLSLHWPCKDREVRPVAEWSSQKGFIGHVFLFPSTVMDSLRGCVLTLGVRQYSPFIKLTLKNGNWTASGKWYPLVKALAHGMRVDFNYTPFDPSEKEPIPLDIVILRTVLTNDNYYTTIIPCTSREACFTFCVPRVTNSIPPWQALVREFSPEVWLLVLSTAILTSLSLALCTDWKLRGKTHAFYLFSSIFGSVQPSPRKSRERFILSQWLMFCMVMTTAYQTVLQSFRMAPISVDSIRNLEELNHSNLTIKGPDAMRTVMSYLRNTPEGNQTLNKMIPYNSSGIIGEDLNRKTAYLCSVFERAFLLQKVGRLEDGRLSHIPLKNKCLSSIPEYLFALPWGSPYSDVAADIILRLTESGITGHLIDVDEGKDQEQPLRGGLVDEGIIAHHRHALLLLVVGYIVSTIAFLMELGGSRLLSS